MTDKQFELWRSEEGQAPEANSSSAHLDSPGASSKPRKRSELWRPEEGSPPGNPTQLASPVRVEADVVRSSAAVVWREDEGPEISGPYQSGSQLHLATDFHQTSGTSFFSWRVMVGSTVLFFLLALVGDAAYGLVKVKGHFADMRKHLLAAEDAFATGDVVVVAQEIQAAELDEEAISNASRRPSLVLATFVPGLERDARALSGLVASAGLITNAAASAVEAASALDLNDRGEPQGLYIDGRVQLEKMNIAGEQVLSAERNLLAAVLLMERLHPRLNQLRVPLNETYAQARSVLDRLARGRTALELVPSMLGAKGPRRYLLAFQALGEARATGGLMGLFGVLEADNGRIDLKNVQPLADIQPSPVQAVDAPSWFRESYGTQSALTQLQQVNVSPNYPAVSEVVLNMYEEATGERLDGVFTMDPIALEGLMAATGDIRIQQPPRVVQAENVSELLLHDSYTQFTPDAQNVFLAQVLDAFWDQLAVDEIDTMKLSGALTEALRTGHVKLQSAGGDQQKIELLGLGGNYDFASQSTQMVFNNNYGANKLDYFLHREITTDIELGENGAAIVETTVELDNQAPPGPPSVLLGGGENRPPGTNLMTLNVLMPPRSEVFSFRIDNEERSPFMYMDDQSPVAWELLEIPPGEKRTLVLRYSVPDTISSLGQEAVFDYVLFPQPAINPDAFSLSIHPPPGSIVREGGAGEIQDDGSIEFSGTLIAPLSIRLQMVPR